jgi:hypothetical protein
MTKRTGIDWLPVLVLVAAVAVAVTGWFLFPRLQRYITNQDCVAAGRTDCASLPQ